MGICIMEAVAGLIARGNAATVALSEILINKGNTGGTGLYEILSEAVGRIPT